MKKRILSVLLAIVMVVGMFPVTAGATAEPVKTWNIGAPESGTTTATDAVVAKLYTNAADNTKYDLVISGTGEMESTHGTSMPWTYDSTYQKHIVSVTVESGVTNVESYAFKDCTALTSVTIGDTVTEIGSFAFNGCTALTSVTLGATVTEIWGYAFGGCTSLTAYTVDSENTAYSATDGILFSKDGTTLVSYPSNKSGTSYTVPNSVTKISSSAFCDVTTLTELTIPHTTTSIVGTIFHGKAFEGKITIKGHTGSAAEDYTEWDSDSTTFVSICSDGDDADTLCDVCRYDTAHAAHPVCGDNECSEHGDDVTFVPWTATDSLPTSGSYYLTADVTLSAIYEPSGTVNLCLNGHTVSSTWNSNVIHVESGNTLNICDCTGTGKITSDHSAATINVEGTASLHSGTVENKNSNGRPGIALNSGSLTVTGGTVTSSNGSGIGVYGGTLILSGAPAISGATADFHMMGNDSAAITIDGSLNNVTPYSVQLISYDKLPSTIVSANATDYSGNFVAANSVKYGIYYDSTSQCVKLAKVEDVPEVHKHPICGDAECASHGSGVTYTAWNGTTAFPGGDVYLTDDVTLTETLTISSGTVNLCLNGHVLSLDQSAEGCVIAVGAASTLNLCDCNGTSQSHKFAVDSGTGLWTLDEVSGTETVSGGVITGGRYGGINVWGNTAALNQYGGHIVGNQTEDGGGVYLDGSDTYTNKYRMFGGSVIGNTATECGGGIYIYRFAEFELHGGTVSSNRAGEQGGGIYTEQGGGTYTKFTMTDGTVSDNTAADGGGIYSSCAITMSGGSITGNSASATSGGVYARGTMTMSGGSITGNTAGTSGGGLYLYSSTTSYLVPSGKVIINNNTLTSGVNNNVYKNTSFYTPVKISGTLDVGSSIGISFGRDHTDYHFAEPDGQSVTSLSTGYEDYFFSDDSAYVVVVDGNNLKLAERPSHYHPVCGATCTHDTDATTEGVQAAHTAVAWEPITSASELAAMVNGKNYYLANDITVNSTVTISGTVNLCLNGHKVSAEGGYFDVSGTLNLCSCEDNGIIKRTTTTNALISADAGATANLYNVTLDGGAVWSETEDIVLERGTKNSGISSSAPLIDAGGETTAGGFVVLVNCELRNNVCSEPGEGGAITVGKQGSLTATKTKVYNNAKTDGQAGAIKAYTGATVNLTRCELYGNKAVTHGGAIQIWGGKAPGSIVHMTMTDCTVRNNKAGGVGGGIAVSDYSDFTMIGGIITENATTESQKRGGGVGFADANTTMTISGNAVISGNTAGGTSANNLYIGENPCNKLTVGRMDDNANVGVTMKSSSGGVFTNGGADYVDKKYFKSDKPAYIVAADGKNLKLAYPALTGVSAEGFTGTYDGQPHGITVTVPYGATVKYGITEGEYTAASPTYTDAGSYTVYYKVTKDGFEPVIGSAVVSISKAPLTVTAKNHTITYGDAPANDGVNYDGFVNNETASVLGGTLDFTYSYTQYGNVGNSYTITPKGLTSDNYAITFTPGTLTVQPKEIGISWTKTTLTYNGSAQKPTATATGVVNNDEVTLTVSGEQTNVGTHTATVSAISNSNYKLPDAKATSFAISAKSLTNPTLTLDFSSFTYDGAENKPTVTVMDGSKTLTEDTDYTITWPADCTSVGTKTITVTFKGNYSGNKTVEYAIVAADSSCTAPAAVDNLVYTGSAQNLVTAATPTGGTVQYSLSEMGTFSESIPTGTDAGTYNVYYKVIGDANHNDTAVLGPVQVKIAKKKVTMPTENTATFAYTGTAQTYMETASTLYEISNETKTNAGSYTVIVALEDSANYAWADGSTDNLTFTFTIAPKAVTVTADAKTMVYGASEPALTYVATGLVAGETLNGEITRAAGTDAGTYDITQGTVTDENNPNYTITFVGADFTITKADASCIAPVAVADLVYTGSAQTLVTAATPTGGTVQYSLSATGTFSDRIPTGTDAGTYDVYYKVIGDVNHNDTAVLVPVQVTISKANQAAPVVGEVDETIFGKDDGKITGVTSAMEYRKDGTDTYTDIVGVEIAGLADGTYYVRLKGDSNHNPSSDTKVVIAAGKKVTVTFAVNGGNAIEAIKDLAYGDKITAPTEPKKAGYTFAGWFSDGACTQAWNFDTDTVTADLTLYAKWSDVPVFHISGEVLEKTGDGENETGGVPNANVKLMLGTTVVAEQITEADGTFYFGGQIAGDYNVVVRYRAPESEHDKIVTVLVALHEHNADDIEIVLPKQVTNSIVKPEPAADGKDSVAAGTLVGGLEVVAAAVRDKNQSADKVEVKLTVKDTPPVTGTPTAGTEAAKQQAQQKAIQQKAGGKQLVFFDLSVVKTINGGAPEAITDTGATLLEIRIPFDSGNKWGITIYRYHGDKAEALAAVNEGSQTEGFWVGDDGYIHIYTHKFSTYAVGYTVPSYGYFVPVTPDTVTSADTFDTGIVVYVTMSMLAATGSAVVIGKKRKEEN